MLAIGVDEMSWDDLNEKHYDWPSVESVSQYRNNVRNEVNEIIQRQKNTPVKWDDPLWVILMGIEHDRIHLETSSVLMRHLPLNMVQESGTWTNCEVDNPPPTNQLIDF